MLAIEAKASLVFIVEDLMDAEKLTRHAELMIPYPMRKKSKRAPEELKQQAIYYNTAYNWVDAIHDIRRKKSEFQVLIQLVGLDDDKDQT